MAIQGLRDTDNFTTNVRPESWRQMMGRLYPTSAKAAPAVLTALTSAMKSKPVTDPKFHWFEKELDGRRLELHATNGNLDAPAAGTVQVLVLTAASVSTMMIAKTVLRVEQTGELLYVMEDPTTDTSIRVMRGFAGSTPTAVDADGANINPNLIVAGYAFEESSLSPTSAMYDPTEYYNYTQIYRRAIEISGTAAETETRTPDEVAEEKRECFEYFGVDMERGFWFGRRGITTVNGKNVRSTNGIINQIPTANNYAFTSGQVTVALLNARMKEAFAFGSTEKIGFIGNQALLALQEAIRLSTNAQYVFYGPEKEYGMTVVRLRTPFGTLVLKNHPLFNQMSSGLNNGGAGSQYFGADTWCAILDMDNITYKYMRNRDVKFQKNLEVPGQDGMKSGFIAEVGLELGLAKTHYLLRSMYSGVAG